jgi:hypothetical protein
MISRLSFLPQPSRRAGPPPNAAEFENWKAALETDLDGERLWETAARLVDGSPKFSHEDWFEHPWFETLACAYERRMRRLAAKGAMDEACNGRDWAVYWMSVHGSRGVVVRGARRPPEKGAVAGFARELRSELDGVRPGDAGRHSDTTGADHATENNRRRRIRSD